ncbi:hypothetical protein [Desulfosporosinus nitroreducens]|nr:hypothetical protein [Desulfosporosinus nitroreducens]
MLEKTYNSMNEQISVDQGLISNTLMSVQNTKKREKPNLFIAGLL